MSEVVRSMREAGGRRRRRLGSVAAATALAALALPAAPAFGEGSVDINLGPGGLTRHATSFGTPGGGGLRTVLQVYAQPGERIQMANSLMGLGAANIRLFAPGADPTTATPVVDCAVDQPGRGRIDSRAEELAGPAPNVGGYAACEFVALTPGFYTVVTTGISNTNGNPGTVDVPNVGAGQGWNASMWDVTVRDAGGAVRPGRTYSTSASFRTTDAQGGAGDFQAYVYTRTGYEYRVNFYQHAGANWILTADDTGLVDAATGERLFASYACGDESDPTIGRPCITFDASLPSEDRRYPVFINEIDPVAINGTGGLADAGYAAAPIAPASNPLRDAVFTGAAGQPAATNRGAGGTIGFTSPVQMEGLDYTLSIDFDRDGTFGSGNDLVDRTNDLSASGSNAFAWNGLDGQGNVPQCGVYEYQIRSTLAEIHFAQFDVENSGGMRIERLSLPSDPALGDVLGASYNNVDPYKSGFVVTSGTPARVTNGTSGPGFNAWTGNTGNTDYVDTWTRLPEISTTGTLRVLCADLRIEKSADSARYQPGGQLSFTLTATNHGPDEAVNPIVRDTLPAGLSVVSTDPQCTVSGQTIECRLPSLAVGARHAFRVTTRVATAATGCLRNAASVSSDTPDPNAGNNQADICVPPAESDVSVVKTSSTSPVVPGEAVLYRLTVSNRGPDAAMDVVVTDRLPRSLRFVSVSRGCTEASGTVTCAIGSLAAGASESFTITMRAPSSLKQCPRNTATVRSLTVDTDLTNNDDSACPPLRGRTDLSIVKTAAATSVQAGGQVMYTLVVRNNGPSDATGVMVEDPLAPGLTLVSAQPGQGACSVADGRVSCNLGALDAGGSTQILVTANAPTVEACPINTATVRGDQQDTNQRNNSSSARICTVTEQDPRFDLVIVKTANKRVVRLGEPVTYTLRVTNKGPDAAPNVRVTDTFNAKGTLVSVKTTVGRCVKRMPITCSLGTMRVGARATITVKLKPTTVGTGQDNTASVTGDGRDENPRDNIDGAVIAVRRVDLRLTKAVDRTVGRAGERFTYTIRVSNPSRGTARNVRVCDDLPDGLVFVGASPKARLTRGQYCWTPIKRLAPGRSRTFRMTVRALRGAGGRRINTAVMTSPDARTLRARRAVRIVAGAIRAGGVTG